MFTQTHKSLYPLFVHVINHRHKLLIKFLFLQDSENSSKTEINATPSENGVKQADDEDTHLHNGTDTNHLITQSVPKTIPNGFASDTATATVVQPMTAKQFEGAGDHNGHHHSQQLLHNGYHSTKNQVCIKFR